MLEVKAPEIRAGTSGSKRTRSISAGILYDRERLSTYVPMGPGGTNYSLGAVRLIVRFESRTSMAVSLALGDEFTRPGSDAAASVESSY